MEDKIIITERNRDGAKIWLDKVENNIYAINTTDDKKYIFKYTRFSYDILEDTADNFDFTFTDANNKEVKGKIYSIDPAGGPYMTIGYNVDDKYNIERIFSTGKQLLIQLKEK